MVMSLGEWQTRGSGDQGISVRLEPPTSMIGPVERSGLSAEL